MKRIKLSSYGFTLVELLVVVGVLAIVAGIGSDILMTVIRAYNKAQILGEIEQNGSFASTVLENKLRSAMYVQVPSGFGTFRDLDAGETIKVTELMIYDTSSSYRVSYQEESGGTPCTNNAGILMDGEPLTNMNPTSGVSIYVDPAMGGNTGNIFTAYRTPDGSLTYVTVSFKIKEGCSGPVSANAEYNTTVTLRGNYGK